MKNVYLLTLLILGSPSLAKINPAAPFSATELSQDYCLKPVTPSLREEGALEKARRLIRDTLANQALSSEILTPSANAACGPMQFQISLKATEASLIKSALEKEGFKVSGSFSKKMGPAMLLSDQWLFSEYQRKFSTLARAFTHPAQELSFENLLNRLQEELRHESRFRDSSLLVDFKIEAQAYREAFALLAKVSPMGLEEAMEALRDDDDFEPQKARLTYMSSLFTDIRLLLSREYFFPQTYDAIAFAATVVLKELQDSPDMLLNELVLVMNHEWSFKTFHKLRRFRYLEMGNNTRALLDNVLNFEPYLDSVLALSVWALRKNAGFDDSEAPSGKIHEYYMRIPGRTIMKTLEDDWQGRRFPHLPVGIPGLKPTGFINLQDDVVYYENWLARHGQTQISWALVPINSLQSILAHQRFRNTTEITYRGCEGFFATK